MKKILAGVLAAASVLSVSATAFAASTDKNVTKPGEVEYDVAATTPAVVLDLVMPAKLAATLNPYGADIELVPATVDSKNKPVAAVTTDKTIASVPYKITNNSEAYGVYIDASAITTVSTSDKTKWTVSTKALVDGTKGAQMAIVATDAPEKVAPDTMPTANAAQTDSTNGVLLLDSTVAANKTTGVAAGQTQQKKFAYVAAKEEDELNDDGSVKTAGDPGVAYLGFTGVLAESSDKVEVEWTEDDAINVALVLKVTAGPKVFPTAAP